MTASSAVLLDWLTWHICLCRAGRSQDVRNNSAWNQRFFVVSHTCSLGDRSVVQREIESVNPLLLFSTATSCDHHFLLRHFFPLTLTSAIGALSSLLSRSLLSISCCCRVLLSYAKKCILVCPNNESPWSYLKGSVLRYTAPRTAYSSLLLLPPVVRPPTHTLSVSSFALSPPPFFCASIVYFSFPHLPFRFPLAFHCVLDACAAVQVLCQGTFEVQ